jgi:hypothetical protein
MAGRPYRRPQAPAAPRRRPSSTASERKKVPGSTSRNSATTIAVWPALRCGLLVDHGVRVTISWTGGYPYLKPTSDLRVRMRLRLEQHLPPKQGRKNRMRRTIDSGRSRAGHLRGDPLDAGLRRRRRKHRRIRSIQARTICPVSGNRDGRRFEHDQKKKKPKRKQQYERSN